MVSKNGRGRSGAPPVARRRKPTGAEGRGELRGRFPTQGRRQKPPTTGKALHEDGLIEVVVAERYSKFMEFAASVQKAFAARAALDFRR
jgi:hypothetical protein